MRCLALAQAWQDCGGRAIFAAAEMLPSLRERLLAEGCSIERIASAPGTIADAEETAVLAARNGASWVVLDGYQFSGSVQRALKVRGGRVLALDDYGHADHYDADFVLNQNLGADANRYTRRSESTTLLLGTRYALLRREFAPYRGRTRLVPEIGRKLLITLGGADPDNVTLKVIQSVGLLKIDGLEAVAVVGGGNPHLNELEAAARGCLARVEVQTNVSDMPRLMAWADVAVAAAGSTSWERALLGLPTIILVLADNQEAVAAACDDRLLGRSLGWFQRVSPEVIAQALDSLLKDQQARATMARRGPEVVDGYGAERVAALLSGERLWLRPAGPGDARLLWEWANHPTVRQSAFSSDPIPWEVHLGWFSQKLASPDCRIFIAMDQEEQPVGQIRFDRLTGGDADVDIAVAPDRRSAGFGAALIHLGTNRVLANGWAKRVHAHIKPENNASRGAFRKAGFIEFTAASPDTAAAVHAVREIVDV